MPSNNKERDLIDTVIITLQRGFKKKKIEPNKGLQKGRKILCAELKSFEKITQTDVVYLMTFHKLMVGLEK